MNPPPQPEPPKNVLRNLLILLIALLVAWIIGAMYVMAPRPFTDDTEEYSAPTTLGQDLTA